MYRRDPLTLTQRLVAPHRAARRGEGSRGCPFCGGHEDDTPAETGRRERRDSTPTDAPWSARSFPNRWPLTEPHEVVVPTPEHVTRWRELSLPQLQDAVSLLLERRTRLQRDGGYVHAFVNDGPRAGASISHVHAQLVVLARGAHTDQLVAGVGPAACGMCGLLDDDTLLVERGRHHALIAHPAPRLAGGLLIAPLEHQLAPDQAHLAELSELMRRAWLAIDPAVDANLWLVGDEEREAHWHVELQPRSAYMAGVELATGLSVSAADPRETAASARERLAMRAAGVAD